MNYPRKPAHRRREPLSRHARLMKSALRKLEAIPQDVRNPYQVLTPDEHEAAVALLRAAVAHVCERKRERNRGRYKPRAFTYQGARYRLAYSGSTLGRVFIVSPRGRNVIASGYDVI